MKLFATDLDGTLLDREDRIHPLDREAIARARERGVIVTLATGRLTSRTHPIARALRLDAPLVCADGGVVACATTERVLAHRPIAGTLVAQALELLATNGLSTFVFTAEAIHSCPRGRAHHAFVRGWSHAITVHDDVRACAAHTGTDAPVMVVGIGETAAVDAVSRRLEGAEHEAELMAFDIADARVIRLMAKGVSKGAALADLAAQLGVQPEHVAVAGDWYNDLSMFAVAARSYAMPHAPPEVKAAASCVLDDGAPRRGAIADALGRWRPERG